MGLKAMPDDPDKEFLKHLRSVHFALIVVAASTFLFARVPPATVLETKLDELSLLERRIGDLPDTERFALPNDFVLILATHGAASLGFDAPPIPVYPPEIEVEFADIERPMRLRQALKAAMRSNTVREVLSGANLRISPLGKQLPSQPTHPGKLEILGIRIDEYVEARVYGDFLIFRIIVDVRGPGKLFALVAAETENEPGRESFPEFPFLYSSLGDFGDLNTERVRAALLEHGDVGLKLPLLDAKIQQTSFSAFALALLVGTQLYFLLHLNSWLRLRQPHTEFPWIGAYEDLWSRLAYLLSVAVAPVVAGIQLDLPLIDLLPSLPAGLTVLVEIRNRGFARKQAALYIRLSPPPRPRMKRSFG